ncbi:MAG: DUF3060 domain-containing protein [Mycobacterium sp.]
MRTHSPIVVIGVAVGVLTAVIGLAGCGGSKSTSPATSSAGSSESSTNTTAQVEIGNTINYGSFGTTADVDCADGKSLNVGGSNNTLTVKGTCDSVNILGMGNKITFDKIDKSLTIAGLNNTVTYKDGDPKVDDHGSGNAVNKG